MDHVSGESYSQLICGKVMQPHQLFYAPTTSQKSNTSNTEVRLRLHTFKPTYILTQGFTRDPSTKVEEP